jgi:Domain of unknown function (DUF4148)
LDKTANNKKAALPGNVSSTESQEIIMNSSLFSSPLLSTRILSTSLYAATLAVALLGTGAAMASEATQFVDAPGTMTRTAVKAELARARANGELVSSYEADQRISQPTAATATAVAPRERAEVRAEARAAARNHKLNELYIGA